MITSNSVEITMKNVGEKNGLNPKRADNPDRSFNSFSPKQAKQLYAKREMLDKNHKRIMKMFGVTDDSSLPDSEGDDYHKESQPQP